MKNVDLFKASKEMSKRVEEFVKVQVLNKKIKIDYETRINAINTSIKSLDNLIGSTLENTIDTKKSELLLELDKIVTERNDLISKECIFEFTKNDTEFKKALKGVRLSEKATVNNAIIVWFKAYGLDVTDTQILLDVYNAIGGKVDFKELVNSNGVNAITLNNGITSLKILYWVAFNHMATVGTIKACQIPNCIKDKYTKKPKKSTKKDTK